MKQNKLTILVAPSLFETGKKELFDAKSGKWIGCYGGVGELNFDAVDTPAYPEPEKDVAIPNPKQINLF